MAKSKNTNTPAAKKAAPKKAAANKAGSASSKDSITVRKNNKPPKIDSGAPGTFAVTHSGDGAIMMGSNLIQGKDWYEE